MGLTSEQAIIGRRDWRERLERDYKPVSDRLQAAYRRFLDRAQPEITELNNRIAEIYAVNGAIRPQDVRGIPVFNRLLNLIEIELNDFAVIARNLAQEAADTGITDGRAAASDFALAAAGQYAPQLAAAFVRPSPEALARLIQITDTPAWRDQWTTFGETAAQRFGDVLLTGTAQGKGPRYLARMASNWLGVPYNWAENTTRTTMLTSYRYANHLTYAANPDIVEGWIWLASLSIRTCVSCWNQHGTLHGLDETLNDHHRGRCTPVPKLIGIDLPIESGHDVFASLSDDQQRAIFGNSLLFDAWKKGDITWNDLTVSYDDDVYGDMLRPPSGKELGLGKDKPDQT